MKTFICLFVISITHMTSSVYVTRKLGTGPDIYANEGVSQFNCVEYCLSRNSHIFDLGSTKFICSCQCSQRFPIYTSSTDNCTVSNKDCKYSFPERRTDVPVFYVNGSDLISPTVSAAVDYCKQWDSPNTCEPVFKCHVYGVLYDNAGWRDLQGQGISTFEISADKELKWIGKTCLSKLLKGFLLKIGLKCQTKHGIADSCLMFRTNGTFDYLQSKQPHVKPIECTDSTTSKPYFSFSAHPVITFATVSKRTTSAEPVTTMSVGTKTKPVTLQQHSNSKKIMTPGTTLQTTANSHNTGVSYTALEDADYSGSGNNDMIIAIAGAVAGLVGVMMIVLIVMIIRRKRRLIKAKLAVQTDLEEYRIREISNQQTRQEEVLYAMERHAQEQDVASKDGDQMSSGYASAPSSFATSKGHELDSTLSAEHVTPPYARKGKKSPTPSAISLPSIEVHRPDARDNGLLRMSSFPFKGSPSNKPSQAFSQYDRPDKIYVDRLREEFRSSRFCREHAGQATGRNASKSDDVGIENKSFEF